MPKLLDQSSFFLKTSREDFNVQILVLSISSINNKNKSHTYVENVQNITKSNSEDFNTQVKTI